MSGILQSVPDWCFFKEGMDPVSYYRELKKLGYAGVEMVDPKRWDAARAAGLKIVNLGAPGIVDGPNKKARRAELVPQIRRSLETAAANGIPQVIVFSGNRQGQDDADGFAQCLSAYKELARDAERLGVTLAFEMLNKHDHPDYMADRSRFGFDLVKAVGSPRFLALYDIYHMQRMGEDALADILSNLEIICHLHVAGSPRRDFPGTRQDIDYGVIVKTVQAAGYTGFWGQEFLPGTGDPFAELEAALMLFNRYGKG
jgi:hydroxypyruvate isomerase